MLPHSSAWGSQPLCAQAWCTFPWQQQHPILWMWNSVTASSKKLIKRRHAGFAHLWMIASLNGLLLSTSIVSLTRSLKKSSSMSHRTMSPGLVKKTCWLCYILASSMQLRAMVTLIECSSGAQSKPAVTNCLLKVMLTLRQHSKSSVWWRRPEYWRTRRCV